jgi:hypothetical protein
MDHVFDFNNLRNADLIKGALYKGGEANNLSSEPISKMLPVGNQSGIRFKGRVEKPEIVVLYFTFKDIDWPDSLVGNCLVYFGDNKSPGKEIHELPGNKILRSIFNNFYLSNSVYFPPIYLFSKGKRGFDRIFEGVLRPGHDGFDESEDLVAFWKTKGVNRFQNYRAIFSLLPIEIVRRIDM